MKDKTSKQNEANFIKRLNIELVSELSLKFNNETITLEENEFIPFKDKIYIKTSYKNNVYELLRIPEFCDAIAEVFCITFKVTTLKNTFRRVIKDGAKETLHVLKTDEKEHVLKESQELLGVNPLELEFWRKLYPEVNFESNYLVDFSNQIERLLNANLPEQYKLVDFGNMSTKSGIQFLKWILAVTGKELNQIIEPNVLEPWHKENIDSVIRDYLKDFRALLWQKSNNGSLDKKKQFHQNYLNFNSASSSPFFNTFYESNKFELQPDYRRALIGFTNSNFDIDIEEATMGEINTENKYAEIIRSYGIGIDIEDDEKIIKDFDPHIYSLIYFEGFQNQIIEVLDGLKKEIGNEDENSDENTTGNDATLIITKSHIKAVAPKTVNHSKANNDYAHTSLTSKKKALAGKKEENKVVKTLRSNGYLVNHVSKLTDSKHYDLEYKKPDGEWRYLEVKKDSGGYFFMSKSEKNTAINNENSSKYDLAIVNGNDIHIIESPFCFENESFENNTKFFAEPSDYIIHFTIDNYKE